jgi:type VI secretion system FHA domain protein
MFLKSCGIDPWPMSDREAQQFMRQLGSVFRELVSGLREALMARATIKGGFPLERTTLKSSNNNPFKFSVSAEEALAAVLGRKSQGYLPGVAAVKEGFRDLNAHQIATVAGMQMALDAVLADLSPDRLKKRLEAKASLTSMLPGAREVSYWKMYEEVHKRVTQETRDKFDSHYAKAFADAYEQESRKV